jgi:hypothetical protein
MEGERLHDAHFRFARHSNINDKYSKYINIHHDTASACLSLSLSFFPLYLSRMFISTKRPATVHTTPVSKPPKTG